MADDVVVPQTSGGVGIRLCLPEYDRQGSLTYFTVELEDPSIQAKSRVYMYRGEGIVDLFVGMANDWKGWSGERTWESLEGEFTLACSSDKAGHVVIRVMLSEIHLPRLWQVKTEVRTEAGRLEGLATDVQSFFRPKS
jgi:hypothetical protein